MEQLTSKAHIE